jgi:hypothetical protein
LTYLRLRYFNVDLSVIYKNASTKIRKITIENIEAISGPI